ncbi:Na+/H+ antiporter subunit E [Corynebacterium sp. 335C]
MTTFAERARRARARATENRPSLLMFVALVVMWQLLWGEVTVGNLVGGVLVAGFISLVVPMPRVPVTGLRINWWAMAKLFAAWAIDFVVASLRVAWLAVRRADPPPSAVIKVPMRTNDDITLASAIALINLQPGGIVTDIDRGRQLLTMHILDGSSTGGIERTIAELARMERRVIRAFEDRDPADNDRGGFGHDHAAVHDEGDRR